MDVEFIIMDQGERDYRFWKMYTSNLYDPPLTYGHDLQPSPQILLKFCTNTASVIKIQMLKKRVGLYLICTKLSKFDYVIILSGEYFVTLPRFFR